MILFDFAHVYLKPLEFNKYSGVYNMNFPYSTEKPTGYTFTVNLATLHGH